jgi:nucleoside phosphorylase/tetratricopeptide (TPR) repeat protein
MLNKTHSPLPQLSTDSNAYELGELNGHYIVITCLPAGVYGTVAAANVVSRLRSTFPRLQYGLMVGIGGGVPGKTNDIRLGDVVVSKPVGKHGGVIPYDYGKTVKGGKLESNGALNKPPQILLTHMSQIEAKRMTGSKYDISKLVEGILARNPDIKETFSAPDQHTDFLFHSSYHHVAREDTCQKCDKTKLINRSPRGTNTPHIHYGLIASGDQVMKDSETRDRLAQQYGILCFEMEAAGLMDELPTLVIRGICDYCDSHKHKQWQGYAALTAAAYAKLLLLEIPVGLPHFSTLKSPRKRQWMVSFARNTKFVGRQDEIAKLEELITMRDGPRMIAITGLGGVGKTQVALELAYRLRDRDQECSVFWIPCTSQAMIEQTFLQIAQKLGLHNLHPAEVREHIKIYLTSERAGKWLLVFDNADDAEMWFRASHAAPPLEEFLPESEQGQVLFTTRNRKLAMKLAPFNVISIPDVDKETAVKILEQTLAHKDLSRDTTTTAALLEKLAFLPLAITQASAYIIQNAIPLSTYLALLQEQEQDAVELLSEDFRDPGRYRDIQNTVITTWLISFQQIQHQNPVAADYLSFFACIGPRNIPESLLPQPTSRKQKIDALGLLNAYSFTNSQEAGISMHRLVHIATRNWIRKNGLYSHWIQRVADQMQNVFPDNQYTNRGLWQEYLPHALVLMYDNEFVIQEYRYLDLTGKVADCLASDGRYQEAEVFYNKLMRINQDRVGSEHPSTLTSMSNLASAYWNQGRWSEAEKLEIQVMETSKVVLGTEHSNTLTSMANLASTYLNQGRWNEAEKLYTQALETRMMVLGAEHPDTLITMSNLASTYRKQGRWNEAEKLGVQVIQTSKKVFGAEHPDTLTSMANLASAYREQGRWNEAEKLGVQVIETFKTVLGTEHPYTLTSMSDLALTFWSQSRWNEAEKLGVQVLATSRLVLGAEHPHTLISMTNLASTYRNQGRWNEAEKLGVEVMEASKIVLGTEHPDTLNSLANLASTFGHQGRWNEAEKLEVQVMETSKTVLGAKHPSTLTSMSNLASTYQNQGRWSEAEKLEVQVMETSKTVLGAKHPKTLSSMANLASTYWNQGRWSEAEKLEVQVMETYKRVLGTGHPDTLTCMANLAYTWKSQGKLYDALTLMEKCHGLQSQELGPSHPDSRSSSRALNDWMVEYNALTEQHSSVGDKVSSIGREFQQYLH